MCRKSLRASKNCESIDCCIIRANLMFQYLGISDVALDHKFEKPAQIGETLRSSKPIKKFPNVIKLIILGCTCYEPYGPTL